MHTLNRKSGKNSKYISTISDWNLCGILKKVLLLVGGTFWKKNLPFPLFYAFIPVCVSCAKKNFNFIDPWRRNEDSRDLWDTRIWRKKDQSRVARSMSLKRRTLQWKLHNTARQIFIVSCWSSKLKFFFLMHNEI
jgi:hypothetical protein